jgi:hypothetical protein
MGNSSWSTVDWDTHATTAKSMSRDEIFTKKGIQDSLNPAKFKYREARDSDANPNSTPIILASDVTGSMGVVAEQIIKEHLGKVMKYLYDHKPVSDPSICCMAIGDATVDTAPIQATQFESDIRLVEQMKDFFIEGGGGGNGGESYSLAWAFALGKVKADIHKKRHKKGYIFTIGDECCLPILKKDHLKKYLDLSAEVDMQSKILLKDVQKDWEVFHLIINPVEYQPVKDDWKEMLGERAIVLPDLSQLSEGIAAIISALEGMSASDISSTYKGSKALVTTVVQDLIPLSKS